MNTIMGQTAKHIIFSGRVQGVGFRFTAHNIASRYQLVGWVRNLPDGTVEMIAQGNADDVSDCIRDISEFLSGYVKDAKVDEAPIDPRHTDFKITF
ncbi:MAG: acylphosphatase [Planctomycetota bacterium]